MNLLVTGSLGFIGRNVVQLALEAGHIVTEFDLREGNDMADTYPYLREDAVINCAGLAGVGRSWKDPVPYWRQNAYAAAVLFNQAHQRNIRVVHCSTSLAEHPEHSPYAASKAAAEWQARLVNQQGGRIRLVRIHNVYGPGQYQPWVVPSFLRAGADGKPFRIENGGYQLADYIYVEDVAKALLAALELPPGIYHAASGRMASPREIAAIAAACTGSALDFEDVVVPLRKNVNTVPDFTPWKGKWHAETTLEAGIGETWEWLRATL